jgi:hypothetical protein
MADTSDAGEIWGDYVKEELDRQVARKASFEQRGLAVITTSGVLVTLLFGLAALSTKERQTFVLPGASRVLLLVALGFFVLAIGAALATNVPLIYRNVTPEALTGAVNGRWSESPSAARRKVAYTRIDVLKSARSVNTVKAWILFGAMACELCALVIVAVAVGLVIAG